MWTLLFLFFYSSLLCDAFIINSVEQLQTLPKTQSEIDISPFLKTQKPSILYSIILKVNNSGAVKVEYLTKIKFKYIKIQLPAISMHVRLPQSLILMYIQICRLWRNRRGFRCRVLHFQLSPTFSGKDYSVLTPRYRFPILLSLSVVLKYKLPVPVY